MKNAGGGGRFLSSNSGFSGTWRERAEGGGCTRRRAAGGATRRPVNRERERQNDKKCYNGDMLYHNESFGFTLSEVLITLGIIGVVAALTLPSLITKINNKGYAEKLIKTYSLIQNVTNKIIEEEGELSTWSWSARYDADTSGNDNIVENYVKHLNVAKRCALNSADFGAENNCTSNNKKIRYLNGSMDNVTGIANYEIYSTSYPIVLADGTVVAISFLEGGNGHGVMWGHPDMAFTIDVNGKKPPNQIGRDIFILYANKRDKGKVLPFTNELSINGASYDFRDTCDTTKSGLSCAYRIISEGKMNY